MVVEVGPSEPEGPEKKHNVLLSAVIAVVVGVILAVSAFSGLIGTTSALLIFALFIVGLLVFHGGGVSIASGLSDHEGYERELEEEEQRKAEEAEYYGETPKDSE